MADLNIVSICGSLRKGSYNAMVQRALPALAPGGMAIKPAPSFSEFPLYNADVQNSTGLPTPVLAAAQPALRWQAGGAAIGLARPGRRRPRAIRPAQGDGVSRRFTLNKPEIFVGRRPRAAAEASVKAPVRSVGIMVRTRRRAHSL